MTSRLYSEPKDRRTMAGRTEAECNCSNKFTFLPSVFQMPAFFIFSLLGSASRHGFL